jgi:TRAP-type C4-dicarboxylate transport system permease small subunit
MKPGKLFETIANGIHVLVRLLCWVAIGALSIMILFVVSNVLSRSIFSKPLPGSIEVIELSAVVAVFFAMAYTEFRRGHVCVELVILRFPRRVRVIVARVMYALATVFFAVMGWRGGVLAWSYLFPKARETFVLSIPIAPFIFVLAFGSAVLALEALIHVFQPLPSEAVRKEEDK